MIINGREIAKSKMTELKVRAGGRKIGLGIVIVGDDPASHVYVKAKLKAAAEIGVETKLVQLGADASEAELLGTIERLNKDAAVHGILVQLPLPKHIDEGKVLEAIDPRKDIDGFHRMSHFRPCTPLGIIKLLEATGETFVGKHAVVIGRSKIVGTPVALMLLDRNCTVTVTHSKTVDLASHTRNADILVVAAGKRNLVTGDMVKPGATVIDVGINRFEGKLYGDVNFDEVSKVAGHITPVPGGVGPMTIAMVIKNVIDAAGK